MKALGIAIILGFALLSCNGGGAIQEGLDWNFYKKKSQNATVKILCAIPDLYEFNFLKLHLKAILKDSLNINALIYYVNKDRIVKTLLDDSRRNSKVIYDIVIADPDVMQSLYSLGLLYGKYLNTLPNNKYLDYGFINALKPNTELRDYVIPYACNQYVYLYDSCDVPNGLEMSLDGCMQLAVFKDENYINNLFYLYRKSGLLNTRLNKINKYETSTIDSLVFVLKSHVVNSKELSRSYKYDRVQGAIMRSSQAKVLLGNQQLTDLKLKYLENDFPVYYKMAGITNTTVNVTAAMVAINELISKQFQVDKFIKTNEDDLPVFNLDNDYQLNKLDTAAFHLASGKITRSKLNFSIADLKEASKWWKEGSVTSK